MLDLRLPRISVTSDDWIINLSKNPFESPLPANFQSDTNDLPSSARNAQVLLHPPEKRSAEPKGIITEPSASVVKLALTNDATHVLGQHPPWKIVSSLFANFPVCKPSSNEIDMMVKWWKKAWSGTEDDPPAVPSKRPVQQAFFD